jgi:hypothetical protein
MGHDTEVRALRQRFPVVRCIGRILHATDVTHPNVASPRTHEAPGSFPGLAAAHDSYFMDSSCV